MSDDHHKPLITYPCRWDYTIIGTDAGRIRAVIATTVTDAEHTVADSRRKGKYCSVALTVTVRDEEHRNRIFMALRGHPDVIMVL